MVIVFVAIQFVEVICMYNKTKWQDRIVQNPSTFTTRDNGDGTVTLIPAPGTVTSQGTPVKAEYMNNMEQGICDAHEEIESIKENYLPTTHASASFAYNSSTGRITYNKTDVKVLNSINAENSTKVNDMQIRGGAGLTGASGYMTFSW